MAILNIENLLYPFGETFGKIIALPPLTGHIDVKYHYCIRNVKENKIYIFNLAKLYILLVRGKQNKK